MNSRIANARNTTKGRSKKRCCSGVWIIIAIITTYIRVLCIYIYIVIILSIRAFENTVRGSTSSIRFLGCAAYALFLANAFGVSGACGVAGRFYDWEWCGRGCRSSGCDALRGAGSAKQGACKRFRRVDTENAPGPASPPDQLYRQRASDCVPPPLQHINTATWPAGSSQLSTDYSQGNQVKGERDGGGGNMVVTPVNTGHSLRGDRQSITGVTLVTTCRDLEREL